MENNKNRKEKNKWKNVVEKLVILYPRKVFLSKMATQLLDLAKDAFKDHNYLVSCEIYEKLLKENGRKTTDLYFGYGDSLAKCGRIKEALDIYAHICYQLCEIMPVDKLKHLASSIIEFIITKRTNISNTNANNQQISSLVDPLCCPVCEDVLKYPVTALCGHTYCRQCCFGRTHCVVCAQQFPNVFSSQKQNFCFKEQFTIPSSSTTITSTSAITAPQTIASTMMGEPQNNLMKTSTMTSAIESVDEFDGGCGGFEQDVLVRRLIEKWWSPLLRASELNEEAERHLDSNMLDEALRCCNQSLEQGRIFSDDNKKGSISEYFL